MHQFFIDNSQISGHDLFIMGQDCHHVRAVLRMRKGDTLSLIGREDGREYRCHIEGFEEDRVHCRLDFIKEKDAELPVQVFLFQGLPKGDKMDFIVEKSVELGVKGIIPVSCDRSVVRYDEKKAHSRLMHWRGKAEAAAKQCRRTAVPEVSPVCSMDEALEMAAGLNKAVIPYELAEDFSITREIIGTLRAGSSIGFFIGPEGGFSEREVEKAEKKGVSPITLGKRILRTETAALVFLSWINYHFE